MKVVQINAVYEYSSTGRIVTDLHKALKESGHDSYVFCTNVDDQKNGVFCMGTSFSRKLHGLMSRVTGLQGYFSIYATKKLICKLNKIQPDAVHLHNLHGNYINVNMLLDYLRNKQIPTVITLHDCWLFTGHCCHYLEDNCNRWQTGCGRCPAKHKWNKSWFFDRSAKVWLDRKKRFEKLESLYVIGVSDWVTNEARQSILKQTAHFKRIYNWIDLEKFKPPLVKKKNERPLILSVSQSWSAIKGLSDILSLANKYSAFHFVLIGERPNVRVPENVEFVGRISQTDELVSWYQKADVLLHLSYQETFGKVIAEAIACGTPAVVYDTTAMPELIGPECGYIVKKGDWQAAGNVIDVLLQLNQINRADIRKYAEERFDSSVLIEEYISLYKNNSSKLRALIQKR